MFTIWFTGLSGAGKTTISSNLLVELRNRGLRAEWLDGDLIRANFSQELGYSKRDRDINVRRIGFVSHLLNKNGVVSVVAAIAPYQEAREANRSLIGEYIEVFVDRPLEALVENDTKCLYRRALAGEITNLTGVNDPYEAPDDPDVHLDTHRESVEESLSNVLDHLCSRELVPGGPTLCRETSFTLQDELDWRRKLAELGYAKP
ncbi:adenylyl-sulfate kinase [Desulfohalovibrio reitneri]|uniref:adenylyl-sulfate kinase n=1 Tax=Desulfohalovibrio reitneri TaxID=1307759 RepID=UPI000B29F5E5